MAHGAFRKGFPGGASGKEHACLCRRQKRRGFHPWVGKVPWRRGYGKPLQCSCLENPMDRGAWRAAVLCVTKCRTRLSNRAFRKMEREKAPGLGWCEVVGPRGCKSPWGGGSAAFVPPIPRLALAGEGLQPGRPLESASTQSKGTGAGDSGRVVADSGGSRPPRSASSPAPHKPLSSEAPRRLLCGSGKQPLFPAGLEKWPRSNARPAARPGLSFGACPRGRHPGLAFRACHRGHLAPRPRRAMTLRPRVLGSPCEL